MQQPEPLTRRDTWRIFSQRCEIRIKCGFACFGVFTVVTIMAITAYIELANFGFNLPRYYQVKSASLWTWVVFGGGFLIITVRQSLSSMRMLRKFSKDMQQNVKYHGNGVVASIVKPYRAGPVALIDMQDGSPYKWARPTTFQWSAMEDLQPMHRQVEFWYLPHSGFAWGMESNSAELDDGIVQHRTLLWISVAIGLVVVLAIVS
jgi:hypothetical protein